MWKEREMFEIKSREFLSQNKLFLSFIHPFRFICTHISHLRLCCFAHHILFSIRVDGTMRRVDIVVGDCCVCYVGLKTHFKLSFASTYTLYTRQPDRLSFAMRWYIHLNKIRLNSLLRFHFAFRALETHTHAWDERITLFSLGFAEKI